MISKLLKKWMGTGKKKKPAVRKKPTVKKKPAAKKKPAKTKTAAKKKPASPKKPAGKKKGGDEIGTVVAFFRIPVVAVIRIKQGTLKTGDRIWIKGHTTDFQHSIASMQINHRPVPEIRKGDEAGIKVSARARIGDRVYRITPP